MTAVSAILRITLITSAAALAACKSDSISEPDAGPVSEIVLTPPASALSAGVPTKIEAVARDSVGHILSGHAFNWSTSDETVARVSNVGEVTGIKPGTATITAATEGKSGSTSVTVVVGP